MLPYTHIYEALTYVSSKSDTFISQGEKKFVIQKEFLQYANNQKTKPLTRLSQSHVDRQGQYSLRQFQDTPSIIHNPQLLKDNFRTTLGQLQHNFRTTLGQIQNNFRTNIGKHQDNSKTTLGQLQDNFRTTLGRL